MSDKKEFDRDSISNTLLVAIGLSLVCSVIVSSAAIVLKPVQQRNEELYRQQIILDVAGIMEPGADVDTLFENIETRTVDLETGAYTDAGDPDAVVAIPGELTRSLRGCVPGHGRQSCRPGDPAGLRQGPVVDDARLPRCGA
jgi:Na+-transporting NADH:ubiquinone oxidoreductase subunit NqrC